jgi:uroporphyrinogen-III decarboxylase
MENIPASMVKMTPKERMIRVLAGEKPDVLPAAPVYLALYLEDSVRKYYIQGYHRVIGNKACYQIEHQEDTFIRANAIYQSYAIFEEMPDLIEAIEGASREWAARTQIIQVDNRLFYKDRLTGSQCPMDSSPMPSRADFISQEGSTPNFLWDRSNEFQDRADIDQAIPILTADQLLERGDLDLIRKIVQDLGDQYFIVTYHDTPFSTTYDFLGFQGQMIFQHDHPDLLHHMLDRLLQQSDEAQQAYAATGLHGIFAQEVLTGADMISPRSYEEFVQHYNQPYFQRMRSTGLQAIHYVCGDVIPRLDQMARYNVSAIAVEESKKKFVIDLEEVVKRIAGRAAVWGNIDAVRFGPGAAPDEMAAEVRRQAQIGATTKGFVVSTGSPFPLDTPPGLIDILVATAHSIHP